MNSRPLKLTFVGRLVVLFSLIIAVGGSAATLYWTYQAGHSPKLLIVLPAFAAAGIFFGVSTILCKVVGIHFYYVSTALDP